MSTPRTTKARATTAVNQFMLPTIEAAFKTYDKELQSGELEPLDVVRLCAQALAEILDFELSDLHRDLLQQFRHGGSGPAHSGKT